MKQALQVIYTRHWRLMTRQRKTPHQSISRNIGLANCISDSYLKGWQKGHPEDQSVKANLKIMYCWQLLSTHIDINSYNLLSSYLIFHYICVLQARVNMHFFLWRDFQLTNSIVHGIMLSLIAAILYNIALFMGTYRNKKFYHPWITRLFQFWGNILRRNFAKRESNSNLSNGL